MGGCFPKFGPDSHDMESSLDDLEIYALRMWKQDVDSFARAVGSCCYAPYSYVDSMHLSSLFLLLMVSIN